MAYLLGEAIRKQLSQSSLSSSSWSKGKETFADKSCMTNSVQFPPQYIYHMTDAAMDFFMFIKKVQRDIFGALT